MIPMRKPKGKLVALLAGAVVVVLVAVGAMFWEDVYSPASLGSLVICTEIREYPFIKVCTPKTPRIFARIRVQRKELAEVFGHVSAPDGIVRIKAYLSGKRHPHTFVEINRLPQCVKLRFEILNNELGT